MISEVGLVHLEGVTASCLPEAVPISSRRNLTNAQGEPRQQAESFWARDAPGMSRLGFQTKTDVLSALDSLNPKPQGKGIGIQDWKVQVQRLGSGFGALTAEFFRCR